MWPIRSKSQGHSLDIKLLTRDLFLRPADIRDHEQWAKVRRKNRDFLKPFEPTWPASCLSEEFFKRRVERLSQDWINDRGYAFLIFENRNLDLIGGININNVHRGAAQHASLGYWIDEGWQGQGMMTQAAYGVLTYAFSTLHLARMNAATLPENRKSRSMLERLGFVEEGFATGYIQIDGRRQDHVLYGLNADAFITHDPIDRIA